MMGLEQWNLWNELLSYLVSGALLVVAIVSAGRSAVLFRNDFAMRIVLSFGAAFVVTFFLGVDLWRGELTFERVNLLSLVISLTISFLYGRWCALRLNHIGWSRWLALLLLVPLVNILGLLVLFFIPGHKPVSQEANAAP